MADALDLWTHSTSRNLVPSGTIAANIPCNSGSDSEARGTVLTTLGHENYPSRIPEAATVNLNMKLAAENRASCHSWS